MTQSFEGKLCSAKNNVTLNVLLSKHMPKKEIIEVKLDKFDQDASLVYLTEMRGNLWRAFISLDLTDKLQVVQFLDHYKTMFGPISDKTTESVFASEIKPYIRCQDLIRKMAYDLSKTKTVSERDLAIVNMTLREQSYVCYQLKLYKLKKGKVEIIQRSIGTLLGIPQILESFMANAMWYSTDQAEGVYYGMKKCPHCRQYYLPIKKNQKICSKQACRQLYKNIFQKLQYKQKRSHSKN